LAAIPSPARHAALQPRLPGLDRTGAVLDARAAFLWGTVSLIGLGLRFEPLHVGLRLVEATALRATAGVSRRPSETSARVLEASNASAAVEVFIVVVLQNRRDLRQLEGEPSPSTCGQRSRV